ncbi:DUF1840 domain-containing protein [Verticiella sediminum]|uniref:DUF1840 domain-containing protein n=1 Tax=Verticiella sediminum TaxID=1247510 RepID=A0A556AEB9_9BURK|nr:DUF1840 domain-containing protein [Verticiella sediminum]TSH91240.1 DUF1840 domain-containing protein [Verticiella sediminum]
MIYTFRSKATGEFIMLGEHAKPLLKAAGKSGDTVAEARGVFTPEQLPAAIAGIERAIGQSSEPAFDEDDPKERAQAQQYVSLRQRAQPLLDMLRKALDKGVDVMWEVSGR